jgi:PAS domain S-box-containing protein
MRDPNQGEEVQPMSSTSRAGNEAEQEFWAELRRQAETNLAQRGSTAPPTSGELQRLLYELEVHQIELEMQNEELRQAQHNLEASRARYFDLYDLAPVGYFTLDAKGLIVEANLSGANLLGIERAKLANRRFSQFVAAADRSIYYRFFQELASSRQQHCEVRLGRQAGAELYAELNGLQAPGGLEAASRYRVIASDISERKKAEAARLAAEEKAHQAVLEKEALLVEWHQLNADNVNIASALVSLRAADIQDPQVKVIFQEVERSLHAMMVVSQKLYPSQDLANIDMQDYLRDLTASLMLSQEMSLNIITHLLDTLAPR